MMSPTSPLANRQLVWHLYSAQAYGIFHGDLDMYFGGWDGRSRMSSIDTKKCPVYMLTGEYDWSNTPEMGRATCDKIPGGKHQAMKGVGHFPATENPKVFVGYCEYNLALRWMCVFDLVADLLQCLMLSSISKRRMLRSRLRFAN